MSLTGSVKTALVAGRVGGNGEDAKEQFAGVLRLEGDGGHILGTVALIEPGWALAVAHCLAAFPGELSVHHLPRQERRHVQRVFWLTVGDMKHEFPFSADAESDIRSIQGARDCLVLLQLSSEFGTHVQPVAWADAPEHPESGTLAISGYGKDEAGNYPTVFPNFGYLKFLRHQGGRGEFVEHDSHRLSGYPMGDDSGAPIYTAVDDSRPVLVGLHAARITSPAAVHRADGSMAAVVFQFLPIDVEAVRRIKAILAQPPAPDAEADRQARTSGQAQAAVPAVGATGVVPNAKRFTFRQVDCCIRMDTVADIAGEYRLYHAKGSAGFRKCDKVTIGVVKDNHALVRYEGHQTGTVAFNAYLHSAGQPTDRCWLVGIGDKKDRYFLLLHRPASGRTGRRLIIEYFKEGSSHPEPHAGNVAQGWSCADDLPYQRCQETAAQFRVCDSRKSVADGVEGQDQDDDGRGDE